MYVHYLVFHLSFQDEEKAAILRVFRKCCAKIGNQDNAVKRSEGVQLYVKYFPLLIGRRPQYGMLTYVENFSESLVSKRSENTRKNQTPDGGHQTLDTGRWTLKKITVW